MKILFEKSENNIYASKILNDEELFASSIHCSYYSTVQLMRHILFNICNEDEKIFDNKLEVKNIGSHNFLITIFTKKLSTKGLKTQDFSKSMRDLKNLRKEADYSQIKITENNSDNALKLAIEINKTLKTVFAIKQCQLYNI